MLDDGPQAKSTHIQFGHSRPLLQGTFTLLEVMDPASGRDVPPDAWRRRCIEHARKERFGVRGLLEGT